MEILKELIRNKTTHLTWKFEEERMDENYYCLKSTAFIGNVGVSWSRFVHKDDQTDFVADFIIDRIRTRLNIAIFGEK